MPRTTSENRYLATFRGQGEFYSGIKSGERVTVREEVVLYDFEGHRKAHVYLSIQSEAHPGAWLVIYDPAVLTEVVAA